MMASGLDFKLTEASFSTCVPPIPTVRQDMQGLVPEIGGFEALSHPAGKLWSANSHAANGQQTTPPNEVQEVTLKQLFSDPTQWWDNRRSKSSHPDFKRKDSRVALWLTNRHKLCWVESQLAKLDVGMKTTSVQGHGAFAAREDPLEYLMCKDLCEDGRNSIAVDALDLLVQRGSYVPNNLFYRVLKRCIKDKDLVLGRRIHALTVEGGYEGNAFLATHLIGLYAAHGRLKEAMRVFTQVPTPDAYNWLTIIFAYARHGEAVEAIRLYRQMCASTTVKLDDRIYSALLKACAAARDLVAGKEVHAHILASTGKPDRFVQAGLVNMYAKCGSLDDARNLFDKLLDRDVVTWTAMIAGYAQQGMGQEALRLYRSMQQEGLTPPNSVTFLCLLQACAGVGVRALDEGKKLHAQIRERGLQEDVVLGGSLVNMYAKCGSLEDARSIFDKLPNRNIVACNAMLTGYAQQGMGHEALSLYRSMQQESLPSPDHVTYVCLLQACASVGAGALDEGKQLHAQIEERGLQKDLVLGGSLVNMFAKCGSLENARKLFDKLLDRDVVTWTSMIAGYAQQGMGEEALSLYRTMQKEGFTLPNSVTYVCLLQACGSVGVGALDEGKQLHAQIKERGLQQDVVLGGSLVNMYAKCGSFEDARNVFDTLPERTIEACNAMLAGYAQQGMGQEALSLYRNMQHECLTPSSVTYVCLLQACASVGVGALDEGKHLHAQIKEQGLYEDVVLGGSLVNMYAKCGKLEDARSVFENLPKRNVVACNAILAGYAQQGMGEEALSLYKSMQQECLPSPDCVTYVCLLQACASVGVAALDEGKQLHAQIKERGLHEDVVLGGSLVNMHAKCGGLEDARSLFDKLQERNVVAWTAMIAGYAQQGMGEEALSLYRSMQQEGLIPPDCVTYVCLLQACASVGVGALEEGKQLHAHIKERGLQEDVILGGSLVNMYAKCSDLEDARIVFDKLADRDVVTWTVMIAGYAQQGMGQEALSLYRSMQQKGILPDSLTYVCLLQACASVAALPLGKQLHAQIQEGGLRADQGVGAAVVNMYAKCGSMFDSQQAFASLSKRTIEAWNTLIGGYARQGDSPVVFDLLDRMRLDGIHPNAITFLSVLTVCSHVGLVDKGREYFKGMSTEYGITPIMEHFICMVDLLGRAGHLDEALQMAKAMPFPPNEVVWHTLLGACRKWKNIEIGQQAFNGAVSVDEKDAASYVLMSNIYARAQMWEAANEMQARRKKLGAWKKPGQSWWTDMSGVVHTFFVGDKVHPESQGIYARLQQLIPKMKKEGYVPHLESSLLDISDDEKEAELCGHSEKLAIAYALNKTAEGTTIRIVKNLRVCQDCHTATAYISKVEKRTIICRDASRFHVYKEGKCSCEDYW